jgi:sirohydrochlorin cobaltochelatase
MSSVIVLAMHGAPPQDFPKREMAEFFELRGKLKRTDGSAPALLRRHEELDLTMRRWPRTPQNDPFYAGSQALAEHLSRETGQKVIVGFNEFCGPDMDETLDKAVAASGPKGKIVVITPMMTRGGEHAKSDIPAAIQRAEQKYPRAEIIYAWPFEFSEVAQFLASQVKRFLQ